MLSSLALGKRALSATLRRAAITRTTTPPPPSPSSQFPVYGTIKRHNRGHNTAARALFTRSGPSREEIAQLFLDPSVPIDIDLSAPANPASGSSSGSTSPFGIFISLYRKIAARDTLTANARASRRGIRVYAMCLRAAQSPALFLGGGQDANLGGADGNLGITIKGNATESEVDGEKKPISSPSPSLSSSSSSSSLSSPSSSSSSSHRRQHSSITAPAGLSLPDDFSGRFRSTCLHVWLASQRLRFLKLHEVRKYEKPTSSYGKIQEICEPDPKLILGAVSDNFWADVTQALLKSGVHALAVDKKVRELHNAFYAHAVTYDLASFGSDADLAYAVARNLYADDDLGMQGTMDYDPANPIGADRVANAVRYIRAQLKYIDEQDELDLSQGIVKFLSPDEI